MLEVKSDGLPQLSTLSLTTLVKTCCMLITTLNLVKKSLVDILITQAVNGCQVEQEIV